MFANLVMMKFQETDAHIIVVTSNGENGNVFDFKNKVLIKSFKLG